MSWTIESQFTEHLCVMCHKPVNNCHTDDFICCSVCWNQSPLFVLGTFFFHMSFLAYRRDHTRVQWSFYWSRSGPFNRCGKKLGFLGEFETDPSLPCKSFTLYWTNAVGWIDCSRVGVKYMHSSQPPGAACVSVCMQERCKWHLRHHADSMHHWELEVKRGAITPITPN